MKEIFKVVLLVIVIVLVCLFGVGWYVLHNPDRYLPKIVSYLEQRTGKQIAIRHIEIKVLPVSVRAYDVQIKNPKPFPAGNFLSVPRLYARIELLPLLHGNVAVRTLVLHRPVIDFINDPDGLWNFQNPGASKNKRTRLSMGVISDLQIEKGLLLGSNLIDPADTPGPVVLKIQNFFADLRQVDFHASTVSRSSQPIAGTLSADAARFGKLHTTRLRSKLQVTGKKLVFKDFLVNTHFGKATGDFAFRFNRKVTNFDTKLHATGVEVSHLLRDFQGGPPKLNGTMNADLHLTGTVEHTSNPLAGIRGSGQFAIFNGQLLSLGNNKKMAQMKRFRDPSAAGLPASAFSKFSGEMELGHHEIVNRRIGVNFYGIDIDTSGHLDEVNGAMDYRGLATILNKQGFFIDLLAEIFKGAKIRNGRMTFPLHLSGTVTNPKFVVH